MGKRNGVEFWQEFVYQRMKTTDSWKNALISHGRGFPACCYVYTHEKQHVSGASGKRVVCFWKWRRNLTGWACSRTPVSAPCVGQHQSLWKLSEYGSPTLQFQCSAGFPERHLVHKWDLSCLKGLGTESIACTLDSVSHLFATFRCLCLLCGKLSISFCMRFLSCNETSENWVHCYREPTCYIMGKSTVDFKMSMGPLFPF